MDKLNHGQKEKLTYITMKSDIKISLILYGDIKNKNDLWNEWYDFSKKFLGELSLKPNFCEVIGNEFKSGKLLKENRCEKRVKKSLSKGETISLIGFDVLPDNFTSAFDYIVFIKMGIKKDIQYIMISLPNEMEKSLDFLQYNW